MYKAEMEQMENPMEALLMVSVEVEVVHIPAWAVVLEVLGMEDLQVAAVVVPATALETDTEDMAASVVAEAAVVPKQVVV